MSQELAILLERQDCVTHLPSCGISIYGTEVVARFAAANPVEGDLVVLERVLQTAASAGAASLNRREVDSCRVDVCVVRRIDVVDAARVIVGVGIGKLLREGKKASRRLASWN